MNDARRARILMAVLAVMLAIAVILAAVLLIGPGTEPEQPSPYNPAEQAADSEPPHK